ncbi:hypothetical protein [Nocardia sp. NPDC052566]|uniref:hypothetical protein n=1 Tax=Nocardia sp. NPDC052566 TaxID=3364330 RepID=UPI0037C75FD4
MRSSMVSVMAAGAVLLGGGVAAAAPNTNDLGPFCQKISEEIRGSAEDRAMVKALLGTDNPTKRDVKKFLEAIINSEQGRKDSTPEQRASALTMVDEQLRTVPACAALPN